MADEQHIIDAARDWPASSLNPMLWLAIAAAVLATKEESNG